MKSIEVDANECLVGTEKRCVQTKSGSHMFLVITGELKSRTELTISKVIVTDKV